MIDILFFAQNKHQYVYFKSLEENLDYKIKVIVSKRLSYKKNIDYSESLMLKKQEIDYKYSKQIAKIYFAYIKLITPFFASNYEYYIKKFDPKIVGFWNGVKYPQNIGVEIAKVFNKQLLFFENGFLPDTTQMDFNGINATNSVPRDRSFYEGLSYEDTELSTKLVPRKVEGNQRLLDVTLPEEFIFVPFQVGYDSQIVNYSKFSSMREFFELIASASLSLDIPFVIKEHPSDRSNDYSDLYARCNEKLMFANNISTEELIEKSKAVITINSSVGSEALLFYKKVFVLGEAFYAIDGVTEFLEKEELLDRLKKGDFEVNKKLIYNFLNYLLKDYLITNEPDNLTSKHFKEVDKKLKAYL